MKKLIIVIALLFTAFLSAQEIEEKVKGVIEIDGHIFYNKYAKDPIIFKADLNGIKIYDSKKEYQKRKCENDNCKTTHLEPKSNGNVLINGWTTANKFLLSN